MQAKKSLGQNFLKSEKFLNDIVEAAQGGADIVLEAGPGQGTLTEKLLEKAGKVLAVEKDDRLIEFLEQKFAEQISAGKLEIIHGDILEFDPSLEKQLARGYKIVANLPYYVTGVFLRKFLSAKNQPEKMVLMLQKEVVKRIVATDGKESLLSLSVKAYGEPIFIEKVPARYFSPAPKIDSAIISISNISKDFFTDFTEREFFEVLKAGFAHKRKILLTNLKSSHLGIGFPSNYQGSTLIIGQTRLPNWEEIFEKCGIPPKARAEDLKLEDWKKLLLDLRIMT